MKILLPNPSTLKLVGYTKPIKEWRDSQKVKMPGARFTRAYKKGWDGFVKPGRAYFNKKTYEYRLTLDRGWLQTVVESFPDVEVEEQYERDCELDMSVLEGTDEWEMLRDYQQESIESVARNQWGKVALATNAGKGAIIALIAKAALPSRTIVLADEIAVFDALKEELEKWSGEEIGLVESGETDPPPNPICLAMIPTLHERVKGANAAEWATWLESFRVALLDEADRATSNRWKEVCDYLVFTEYRAGFSGSFPKEGSMDAFNLRGLLGSTLIQVKNEELVEREISAKPIIQIVRYNAPRVPNWRPPEDAEGEDREPSGIDLRNWVYEHAVLKNPERHALIRDLLHPTERNVIIVNRIDHGESLAEFIPDSVFVHGSVSKTERRRVLDQFEEGEVRNLIATNILDRGSNRLGAASGLIFASGAGSFRQTLQRIGRGLRRGKGKKEFIFIRDIFDIGNDYLEKAATRRMNVYKDENFDLEIYSDPSELSEVDGGFL